MAVHQIVYRSDAAIEMSPLVLTGLLDTARANNARLGLTGLLVYAGGQFAQVIEGERGAVDFILDRIRRDYRHRNIEMMGRADAPGREFGEWEMAFAGDGWTDAGDWQLGDADKLRAQLATRIATLADGSEGLLQLIGGLTKQGRSDHP